MEPTSHAFKANAHRALGDANLQRAMTMMRTGFPEKRAAGHRAHAGIRRAAR